MQSEFAQFEHVHGISDVVGREPDTKAGEFRKNPDG